MFVKTHGAQKNPEIKNGTSKDHQDRFDQEMWEINYYHTRIVSGILILIFTALFIINVNHNLFPKIIPVHLFLGVCSLLYWGTAVLAKKRSVGDTLGWRKFFVLSYSFLFISTFGFTVILWYTNDIVLYLLPVFTVGLIVLMRPKIAFIFFATTHLVFTVFYALFSTDPVLFIKNMTNSTIAVILILVVIRLNYHMKRNEFENRIIIEERTAELEKANQKLHELATTDELTGLPNRRAFMQSLKKEMERAQRYQNPLSVMILDLDHFKTINDTHGHFTGDAALQWLTSIIKSALRESDIPGRLGGEEFGIILPGTDLANGAILAERLRNTVSTSIIHHQGSEIALTVSIGMAGYNEEISSMDELLRKADDAMYEAKTGGRNRIAQKS